MKDSNGQGFFSAITLFLWQIGEVVLDLSASIADAPIVISMFGQDNLFKTNAELTTMLSSHYLNSILWQLYKIVGSLELVGNPLGLVSSLGTGVKDFFYEPVHALYQSREIKRFGKLAVKGASSLVGHAAEFGGPVAGGEARRAGPVLLGAAPGSVAALVALFGF